MSSIATKQGVTRLLQRNYQFDPVGNIDQMTSQAGDTLYSYDDTYQLTGADHPLPTGLTDETYSFDKVGNRLTSSATPGRWSHNQNNELLDTSAARYEYDANGNTTKKTVGTQVTRYEYNARNRLSRVILPNGQVASYSYDPFGRRVKKQVDSVVTWYVYADEGLVGEYSASGGMQKAYGWKPGGLWGTDPLYMLDGSGTYFYHNDHLGTPQRMSDATTGAVVWSAGYQAFGLAAVDPLSTVESNLRFPGQYFDAETGLHFNFNRYYEPENGRYTQVDPIGFVGGTNLSQYVYNNPVNFIDYRGLNTLFLGGAGTESDTKAYAEPIVNKMKDAGVPSPKYVPISRGSKSENLGAALLGIGSKEVVSKIAAASNNNGGQRNIVGYSYGSILGAEAAMKLASEGVVIDNLILIGSPLSSDGAYYKLILQNPNIKNVVRIDILDDPFSDGISSNPFDYLDVDNHFHYTGNSDGQQDDLVRDIDGFTENGFNLIPINSGCR